LSVEKVIWTEPEKFVFVNVKNSEYSIGVCNILARSKAKDKSSE